MQRIPPRSGERWCASWPPVSTPTRSGGRFGSAGIPSTAGLGIRTGAPVGSTPWCPNPCQCTLRTPVEVLELAVALRPENPDRTAGAIQRILRAQLAGDRIALRGRGS